MSQLSLQGSLKLSWFILVSINKCLRFKAFYTKRKLGIALMLDLFNELSVFFTSFYEHKHFWKFISIPFVAAFVGWGTNWLAIQLTFYPVDYVGFKPFGWQGVIPAKGEKMAGIVIDNTLAKISTMSEIFEEFEPDKIAHHIIKVTDARIEEYTDDIMSEKNAVLWENLPNVLKNRVYNRARKQLPSIMDNLLEDMQANIDDLIDAKLMIVRTLTADKNLLNRVFKECGAAEFKFVVNSGMVFGFLFGIIQMFVWYTYPAMWVLPVFGLIVGLATNWMALNLIFRPLNPVKVGPWKVQGLFLARQNAVSEVFCRIITSEILTVRSLMTEIYKGPKAERSKALIKKHLRPILDGGVMRTVAQLTVGPEGYVKLKRTIEEKAIEFSLASFDDPAFAKERAVVVEKMFRDRMQAMTPGEFQNLLRPAFQEDEWILILIGGVLGFLAGVTQLLTMFAGSIA